MTFKTSKSIPLSMRRPAHTESNEPKHITLLYFIYRYRAKHERPKQDLIKSMDCICSTNNPRTRPMLKEEELPTSLTNRAGGSLGCKEHPTSSAAHPPCWGTHCRNPWASWIIGEVTAVLLPPPSGQALVLLRKPASLSQPTAACPLHFHPALTRQFSFRNKYQSPSCGKLHP